MRIIDELTEQEIVEPDLTAGYVYETEWVSREWYALAEEQGLPAVPDEAYEHVLMYHVLTEQDIANEEMMKEQAEAQEVLDALPDAVADLSEMVSDNAINIEDVMDAIAELSEIVSNLMEGE